MSLLSKGNETQSSQKPEIAATNRQTSKDPNEMGNRDDAVFPTDGAGAGASSLAGFNPEAAGEDVGEDAEDCGERPSTGKK